MSEIIKTIRNTQNSRAKKILLAIAFVLILLIVYGAGIVILPISILYNYQNEKCDSAVSLDGLYTNIYPPFIQDKTLDNYVTECTTYTLAGVEEEKGAWRAAYDAYQVYVNTYPNGIFIAEANKRGAAALLKLAKEQLVDKKYNEVIESLDLVSSQYKNTDVSADAEKIYIEVYTDWGTSLRVAGDFEGAERTFGDFKAWATQAKQQTDQVTSAQRELAQTYLAWGLALQAQKKFEDAKAKFDMATSADPEPQSDSGAAAQVRANQLKFYTEWGDDFIVQKNFAGAIEQYNTAVTLSGTEDHPAALDTLAKGYIQWASNLSANEDFLGALEQLDTAKNTAVTNGMKQTVDTALGETYLAFSNSSGSQARRAMKDALKTVCDQHAKPELPIFGLNKEKIMVGIYGADAKLPENLAATTPGEMHYIACIEVENHTIGSTYHMFTKDVNNGYYYLVLKQSRVEIMWNISLRNSTTSEVYSKKTLEGGTPPPYPTKWDEYGSGFYYGDPPDIKILTQWLQSAIK